jgi:hypothetical protein
MGKNQMSKTQAKPQAAQSNCPPTEVVSTNEGAKALAGQAVTERAAVKATNEGPVAKPKYLVTAREKAALLTELLP